jgi:hypothetical protein
LRNFVRSLLQQIAAALPPEHLEKFEMGLFTADIKTMDDLFVHQLKDIYYAEKRIVVALPKMIEKNDFA